MADDDKAQQEATLAQKPMREAQQRAIPMPSWPHDEDGNPMAIIAAQASDLTPTVKFGNVCIGPVMIMRPVPNTDDREEWLARSREILDTVEEVISLERRLITDHADPATKV